MEVFDKTAKNRPPPGDRFRDVGSLGARASRPQRAEGPPHGKAGGTPMSRGDTRLPGHASLDEAPSRQPQALYGQGP